MVTILKETPKDPITLMGERAGVCWGADISDRVRNYKRGLDCIRSGHHRVMEYAGVDMILMPDGFEAAYEGVLAAVRDGVISEERINESLKRIYRIKYRDRVDQDGNVVDNMAAEQQTGEGGEEISANPEEAPDSQPEGEAAPAIQEGEPAE